jgi:hypothetical protein
VTEKDLTLKTESRRLLWRMGFTTRVNVGMRAYVPPTKSRSRGGIEEYTDLDVLGIALGPDFRLESVIADCKSSARRSTERMFWLRGLADFFGADNAYLVRASEVTAAARQLAGRLELAIVTPPDLRALEEAHPFPDDAFESATAFLFDDARVSSYQASVANLPRTLRPLLEYCKFDFWVYEPHRNVQQVVAHLIDARRRLDFKDRLHLALFFDAVWLATLSIARCVQHVRRAHLVDIDTSLQEYLFGGQLGLREKQLVADTFRKLAGRAEGAADGVLPSYYAELLELTTRFARRPSAMMTCLRYAEWLSEAFIARQATPIALAFRHHFDPLAGKLLGDVAAFLARAAGLDQGFATVARELLAAEGVGPAPDAARAEKAVGAQSPGKSLDLDVARREASAPTQHAAPRRSTQTPAQPVLDESLSAEPDPERR